MLLVNTYANPLPTGDHTTVCITRGMPSGDTMGCNSLEKEINNISLWALSYDLFEDLRSKCNVDKSEHFLSFSKKLALDEIYIS